MPIPASIPVRFTPRGLADAYDSTDVFLGACRGLSNLVFDPSNPELVVVRPGIGAALTSFAGFTTPGFVSIQVTIGTRVFGMVATGLTAGIDQPFCYDLAASAFVAVTGSTAGNAEGRPASPATSGAWTPPTMAVIGNYLIITHPGYTGVGISFFGAINLTTLAYTSQNAATNLLTAVPKAVTNLNNRAYFAVNNTTEYTDVLNPLTRTLAGMAITLGDSTPVLGLSGLPIQTTTSGIAAALLVFKEKQIWQIIGDAATTLATNYLSLQIGCAAPRSIQTSPLGVFFAGPDAPYIVTPMGAVTQVANQLGQLGSMADIAQPFANVTQPSRIAGAFAANIYRVCIPTVVDGLAVTADYWFDTKRLRWNGPHTFNYDCASSAGTYFILSGVGALNKLFASTIVPKVGSSVTDNAVAFNVILTTTDFPKRDEMSMKQIIESTIELASSGASVSYSVQAFDEAHNFMSQVSIATQVTGAIWGAFIWGDVVWGASLNRPKTYVVPWDAPLVFNKFSLTISAVASTNVAIGTFYARMQKTQYTLQVSA